MTDTNRYPPWFTKTVNLFRRNGLLRPGRLLRQDIEGLVIRYASDWTTITPLPILLASTIYIFFANLFPALTFANDLYLRTGQNWGPIEVILGTGMCGTFHALFSIQPLTILSVTGPFSVLAESIYKLTHNSLKVEFLPLMTWTLVHTGWMLILLATFNAYEWTMVYVTNFTCEIFGLLTSIFYFHKAVSELQGAHKNLDFASFLYGVIACMGTLVLALVLNYAEKWTPIFGRRFRKALKQYAAAISIGVFVAISKAAPELRQLEEEPVRTSSTSFRPSHPDRQHFYVHQAWQLPATYIFGAMLPALLVTMLLFFDHNISTIICTTGRHKVRKPSGLTQPIVLLGLATAACGIMGIPPANGLLPQSPFHSESLALEDNRDVTIEDSDHGGEEELHQKPITRLLEQRWTNFLQSGVILAFIAPPLQKVLGYTPTTVLAGLFLFMCWQNISTNPLLKRTLWLMTPRSQLPSLPPGMVTYWPMHGYTLLQITCAIVIFVITMTPAGPGFPILVFSLVPFRLLLMKRLWSRQVLRFVDGWTCKDGTPEDDQDDDEDSRASRALREDPGETPIYRVMIQDTSYRPLDMLYMDSAVLPGDRHGRGAFESGDAESSTGARQHAALYLRPSQFQLC